MRAPHFVIICSLAIGCGHEAVPHPQPGGDDLARGPIAPPSDLGATRITVDIGNGATIEGALVGHEVTLLAAPTRFTAPLHVTLVSRLGYAIHDAKDLAAACAAPLSVAEPLPTFAGDVLFDPLSQTWLEATVLHSPAGQIAQLDYVHVTNAPVITRADASEASWRPAIQFALDGTPHDAQLTSDDWSFLCSAAKQTGPSALATIDIGGTFDGKSYAATIHIDTLALDVK